MPESLRKIIGVVLLVLSLGGVSCESFIGAWYDGNGDVIEKIR